MLCIVYEIQIFVLIKLIIDNLIDSIIESYNIKIDR